MVRAFNTTRMLDRIAAKYGRKLHETSIGFKYIADLMMEREILIGGEESGGIGYSRFLPERDGVLNSLLLANVMAEEGKPLGQLVADLQREFGPHYYGRRDLHIPEEVKQNAIQRARADGTQSSGPLPRAQERESRRGEVLSRRSHEREWRGSVGAVPSLRHRAAAAALHRGSVAGVGERDFWLTGEQFVRNSEPVMRLPMVRITIRYFELADDDQLQRASRFAGGAALQPHPAVAGRLPISLLALRFLIVSAGHRWSGLAARSGLPRWASRIIRLSVFHVPGAVARDQQGAGHRRSTTTDSGWSVASNFPPRDCDRGCGMKSRAFWSAWCWERSSLSCCIFTIRQWPQHWWLIAWALFMGLFILLAQLAPVVLFPIFYKFEPLENEDLRRRLVVLERACGNARARRLPLEAFGKEQEGECRADRTGRDAAHHSGRHAARQLHRRKRLKRCWRTNSAIMCTATS